MDHIGAMAKKRIRDIRNEAMIAATIQTVYERGYQSVTMAEIAAKAGTSAASISYYFGSKEGLLEATMRYLLRILQRSLIQRFKSAATPEDRLYAIVDANFDDSLFTVEQCSIWMQFWGSAPYTPRFARLHRINRSRVRSHLRHELRAQMPADQAEVVRSAIQCYMDGVWLQATQSEAALDAAAARREARRVVTRLLSDVSMAA
ncbi:transcriptional regulator BetI [Tritonibacter multivorans]|uniref:HTH-type transcriptional regulator BetI n=2 Tax=Tritonibacter multivorans TaxID=928856 RepID=A0A0N7LZ32_9RHOB|nr:transcriptional regulator BetI [Tritonibacter multivorans]SFD46866.1 transcriptional regulator, TetR family [Tritonibacter multivorans]